MRGRDKPEHIIMKVESLLAEAKKIAERYHRIAIMSLLKEGVEKE